MPRPFKRRFVNGEPGATSFKPAGVPGRELATVELRFDELEAIRLADLEGLYQEEAAKQMGISRATFGRVLDGAHRKVADALLQGKMLVFKGGNVAAPQTRMFTCMDCGRRFSIPFGVKRPEICVGCQSHRIQREVVQEVPLGACRGRGRRRWRGGRECTT
jgi:uncharacterized protein